MRRAAAVLVLGDLGAIRDELLLRPEVDVIWSASFDDALDLLRVYRVEACIIAPEFEALSGFEGFRGGLGGVPVLVHRPGRRAAMPGGWCEDVEEVLAFLARHTGLVFARYPRAAVELPVTIEAQGARSEARTLNLSVSGMAVRGFPDVPEGARVEVCLELPDQPVYLLARVVRVQDVDGARQAGLSFTDLGEAPRAALARCVEATLCEGASEGRLFGELEVPLPRLRVIETRPDASRDLSPPLSDEGGGMAVSAPPVRTVGEPSAGTDNLPPWFEYLSEDISDVERLAAIGADAPEWAHRVLRLRISLARARAAEPGEVPLALLDEAYRTFAGLEVETADAPAEVQRQVSSIRASLFRDVLGEVE